MHPLFPKASKLTETIIGAAIEVHRDKGPGLIESIYEWCLMRELELRRLAATNQRVVRIDYKGFTKDEPLRCVRSSFFMPLLPLRSPVRNTCSRFLLKG